MRFRPCSLPREGLVGRFVGCDLSVAYVDAHELIAQQRVLEHMGVLTVAAIAGNLRLQQKITQAAKAARLQAALASAPHNTYRAHLLSQGSAEASAWLLSNPGKCFHLMLINDDFKFAARQWLGFSVLSLFCPHRNRGNNHIRCLACCPLHLAHVPSTDITNKTGDHGFKCRGGGKWMMAVGGFKSRRHNGVLQVLVERLRAYTRRPAGEVTVDIEPHMLGHGVPAVANNLMPGDDRADVLVTGLDGSKVFGDLTIVAPITNGLLNQAATVPGLPADEAVKRKIAKYAARFSFPAAQGMSLQILAMETGGRMHPSFKLWLQTYLKAATNGDHMKYYWAWKTTVQRISVSLRRSIARSMQTLEGKALRYPDAPRHNGVLFG